MVDSLVSELPNIHHLLFRPLVVAPRFAIALALLTAVRVLVVFVACRLSFVSLVVIQSECNERGNLLAIDTL